MSNLAEQIIEQYLLGEALGEATKEYYKEYDWASEEAVWTNKGLMITHESRMQGDLDGVRWFWRSDTLEKLGLPWGTDVFTATINKYGTTWAQSLVRGAHEFKEYDKLVSRGRIVP
jgi:hypothetical protein